MPHTDQHPPTLLEAARKLLLADKRSTLEIHKQSGLPVFWLRKLRSGETKDPSVNRVQALYEFLSNTKLLKL